MRRPDTARTLIYAVLSMTKVYQNGSGTQPKLLEIYLYIYIYELFQHVSFMSVLCSQAFPSLLPRCLRLRLVSSRLTLQLSDDAFISASHG